MAVQCLDMFLLFDGKIGDQVTLKKKRYSIGTLRDILSAPQVLAAGCVDKTVRCLLKKEHLCQL